MYTLRQPGVYDNDGEDEWIICLCERTTVQLLTVAMKFIVKHGKSDKDIDNLRQEIEVYFYGL